MARRANGSGADRTKDLTQEHVQPIVGEPAGRLKDNLRKPTEQAVEPIKTTDHAGSTVAGETRPAAEDVKGHAQDGTDKGQGQTNSSSARS
jgi:hypothetical protein